MKDGKPPPQRLSAKLNTDLDRIRQENAALTKSQLASFRSDLTDIVSNALTTIEADTKAFQSWNDMLWREQRQTILRAIWYRRWTTWAVMLALGMTLFCLTWVWSAQLAQMHQNTSLEAVGLQLHRHPDGMFLTLDPSRIMPTTCTLQGRALPCLQVEN
ncbi:MAG: hypothetical protein ACK8QZ_01905 [Anaerolineales bacterium]